MAMVITYHTNLLETDRVSRRDWTRASLLPLQKPLVVLLVLQKTQQTQPALFTLSCCWVCSTQIIKFYGLWQCPNDKFADNSVAGCWAFVVRAGFGPDVNFGGAGRLDCNLLHWFESYLAFAT